MRQFWRTVTGKMLLFLSCGVCGILFAATILGSVVMVETDFYTREEKAIREEVFNGLLSREGRSLTWKLENDSLSEEEAQGSTGNLTWQIVGMDGKVKAGVKDSKEKWQYTEYYEVYENEEGVWTYPVYDTHVKTSQDQKYDIVHFNIDESLAKQDAFFIAGKVVHILYGIRYTIYIIMAFAFVLGLISFVTLMNVTGRRTGSTELYTGPLYGIPADLLTVIIGTGWLVMSMAVLSMVNTASYIEETVRSVLNQTYTNWELIIVDDCSTDNTDEILDKISDDRIRIYKNKKNAGAAVSRNRALREAKGRWIAFLDSDDLWFPDKLEKQLQFMKDHNYHFSYTNYEEIDMDGNKTGVLVTGPKKITKTGMFNYCWPGCLTVMYDADYVGLIQIEDIKKNNDYAMWLKVCKKADCYLLDECLGQYRKGRVGSISTHSYANLIKWHYRLFREAENQTVLSSLVNTMKNMGCGYYKKKKYVLR